MHRPGAAEIHGMINASPLCKTRAERENSHNWLIH
jgi:hypothetical protein